MEDKLPLHPDNKVYELKDLKPKFVTDLQNYFRKLRLKRYKNKKVKESKTDFHRHYNMKFKIHISDEFNPQVSDTEYEMIIPARAVFFAKRQLNNSIKEKIIVEVTDFEELNVQEYAEFIRSKEEFIESRQKS